MARRHSSAAPVPVWGGQMGDSFGMLPELSDYHVVSAEDGSSSSTPSSYSALGFLASFPQVSLRANNKKFVCRHGADGALKAIFNPSRQGWLQRNEEVFTIEWATPEHGELDFGRARSNSHVYEYRQGSHRDLLHDRQSGPTLRSTHEHEISPYFALRADNGQYCRVSEPQGILVAIAGEETTNPGTTTTKSSEKPIASSESVSQEGNARATSPRRPDAELFTVEVHHVNLFTIRNKATGTYVEMREDGLLCCDQSSALQIAIKESQLFQLALKVGFKTSAGPYISMHNNGLVPCQKTLSRKEIFIIQLGSRNMCTISTTKKRLWRVHKKGWVTTDGKPSGEPSKEELFLLEQASNGLGWTILSVSLQLYLRAEGTKRLVFDVERSPSGVPPDPNCYFAIVHPEKSQDSTEEDLKTGERRRYTVSESGGIKKLRRIIETFETQTSNLPLEDLHDPEFRPLEGERIALLKHHMLSFQRCEAVLGTIVLTNYRLAFYPCDPRAMARGAEGFSFPLGNTSKVTKLGSITTDAGNYHCLHIALKDFRSFYFSSIPFTIVRKPKMDTLYQVLEDHIFPTRLSDFFAFAHQSAMSERVRCPTLHTPQRDFTRAVRKAIGDPSLASWRCDSPLGLRRSSGFTRTADVLRLNHGLSIGQHNDGREDSNTSEEGQHDQESSSLEGSSELGQLKSELFGMASQSPINAPLFAKEVEAKWVAKEQRAKLNDKEDALLKMPFLSTQTIPNDGWELYSPMDDITRLALDISPWRVSPINWDYTLCESYPRLIVVPSAMSDEEIRQVKQFRSKGRIPVPTWRHRESGSVIVRCSQPKTGLLSDRSEEDEKLISSIRQACGTSCTVYLIDARPRVNAVMNTITGAGVENVAVYNIALDNRLFLGIPNIHVVRESGSRLTKVIDAWNMTIPLNYSAANDAMHANTMPAHESDMTRSHLEELRLLDKILDTGWLDHITALLSGAAGISKLILDSSSTGIPVAIIVHCSDGWDRTPQLVALAQLLLDPFYRTIHGFEILIEKEFVSFGHRFHDRCGHQGKKDKDQRSPIFHQFLECTWQLLQQFPSAFEFNELFLETLLEHTYSCRFGTFLLNSQRERILNGLQDTTFSLWTFINGFVEEEEGESSADPSEEVSPRRKGSASHSLTGDSMAANSQWEAIVQRRRKYVNPRYIHGRHHHLVPVINLCQRDPSLATSKPHKPTDPRRRNSDPGENVDSESIIVTTQRSESEGRRAYPRPVSPRSFRAERSPSMGSSTDLGPLSADDEESEEPGELSTPNISLEDYDFEVIDNNDAALTESQTSSDGAAQQGPRTSGTRGVIGYGREDVEDMLEYLGNKWRRAGIGFYHAPIDRALGAGPDAGSIRFWAALYLRWRAGDILFPTPIPAIFLSPASLPASPTVADVSATEVVALASTLASTAVSSAMTSSGSTLARVKRSTSSAPALGRPLSVGSSDSVYSRRTSIQGSGKYKLHKGHTLPASAQVQLTEIKRTATKTKADATLYTLSRASRAD